MTVAVAAWDWPAFSGGGAAALLHTAATGLVEAGVDVRVWTRGGGDRDGLLAASPAGGLDVLGLPGRSWRSRGTRHWERGVGKDIATRGLPDAVLVGSLDALPGVASAVAGRAPIACVAHGRDVTGARGWSQRRLRRRALSRPGVTWLTLSRWLADELEARGIPRSRIRVVPAAVPSPPPDPVPSVRWSAGHPDAPGPRLVALGRLIPRKGQGTLLDVLPRLREEHPRLRLDIIGDGPLLDSLRRQALDLDGVAVMGHLEPAVLEGRWRNADLLVLPCHEGPGGDTEGYGLVFLEAAARDVAAVGGATAGAAEAVAKVGGFPIADPQDPDDVARTVLSALSDRAELCRRAVAARRTWESAHRPVHLGRAVLSALGLAREAA